MNILIGGDFFISNYYNERIVIDESIVDVFNSVDYRIVNLESPLTSDISKNKILKSGPHLSSLPETTIPYLKQLKIDAVTLANNHILDYGENGILDTLNSLSKENIEYVGIGKGYVEASRPLFINKNGIKVAVLNFCENEWSVVNGGNMGANPLDVIDNINQIKQAKDICDKVICIIHGGHEYFNLPSPRMVKQYRFYADNGADAIIGHHTHCISGFEIYNNVPILYSLGNLLFSLPSSYKEWYSGLVVKLFIEKGKTISFSLFSTSQDPKSFKLKIDNEGVLFDVFHKLNNAIKNPEILNQLWLNYQLQEKRKYFNTLSVSNVFNNKYFRGLLNKMGFGNLLLTTHFKKFLLNNIRCQSHHDMLKNLLESDLRKR
ncbi:CapA family protein [Algoriphagus sp. AK58]|uniref:CapA family protein n=1 Tax=Algoriphagus sp. AK58 TaxID=1406877 RepID=UPI00164F6450|nr:CapA family protein [Algoriphagus sp. AK58]MBC6369208.1 hypothetical protein [Algoriphagus sp. AK58]